MTLIEPTELDLAFHKACVAELVAFGTLLDLSAGEYKMRTWPKHGIEPRMIKALLFDLQNILDEWHGQVPEPRIHDLQQRVFNVAPELNLLNP